MDFHWNVLIKGESKSVNGSTSETEDWYLVRFRSVNCEWIVGDGRVNVRNLDFQQY